MHKSGAVIHDRRIALGLTCQALAERIGVSAGTIVRYESGEIKIKYDRLIPLSDALGITVSELMGWGEYKPMEADDFERLSAIMRGLKVVLPDGSVDFKRLAKVEAIAKAADSFVS